MGRVRHMKFGGPLPSRVCWFWDRVEEVIPSRFLMCGHEAVRQVSLWGRPTSTSLPLMMIRSWRYLCRVMSLLARDP